jgi:hypothetical protein
MKQLAIGLCLLVGIICRSEAQLDGNYTIEMAGYFDNFLFYRDGNYETTSLGHVCTLSFVEVNDYADRWFDINVGTEVVHNPKTGAFKISGQSDFGDGAREVYPYHLNPLLPDTDAFYLASATTTIIGKTYTSKSTRKPTIDISSGLIKIAGQYDVGIDSQDLVNIVNGSVSFKKSGIDLEKADVGLLPLKISGSVVLNNKRVKKFNSSADYGSGIEGSEYPLGYPFNYVSSYLILDIKTEGSAITGTAEIQIVRTKKNSDYEIIEQEVLYPLRSNEAKWWKYSVKGTRKNGIATLNLTGLGVIKGLKAAIYLDDYPQDTSPNAIYMIPNGKNTITLYGQTIKY